MGPPGGGKNPITGRFLRHFNYVSFNEMADESIQRIFTTVLGTFLRRSFDPQVADLCDPVVAATVALYNSIRTELLPTPSKSHYIFNLRDVARVMQGVMRATTATAGTPNGMLCLWLHELTRVFADRLVNNDDKAWFGSAMREQLAERMGEGHGWDDIVTTERLIFGDYLVPGAEPRVYAQATDMDKLVKSVEEQLDDYNSVSNTQMKLVLFLDALEHVSRICRVIRLPLGNALLLGVGGSGRQSLTRLATYMEEFELFQVEIAKGYGQTEWKDDLKRALLMAGVEGKPTTFLFVDTQIVWEGQLEDINGILNAGDVPNLMDAVEDQETIATAMRPILKERGEQPTKLALYAEFNSRVRANLHMVICMSPIGAAFASRMRMFPSLINCCAIDWFSEWPAQALSSVATNFLSDVEMPEGTLPKMVDMCVHVHQSVEKMSRVYFDELRRTNHTTPTSYLELLNLFLRLNAAKKDELNTLKSRLEIGLDKLLTTEKEVQVMQEELTALQPVLAQTAKEADEMLEVITVDKAEADKTKAEVRQQEEDANKQAAAAKAIADDAQRDLDQALPALEAALKSLKSLQRSDIVEVKAMRNPPAGVKLVMEATCIMFGEKPKMVDDPNKVGKKIADYWEQSTKLVSQPDKFLDSLLTYDKENISDAVIKKIEPYISDEGFTPEAISKASKACTSICMWVRAMYTYNQVAKQVEPKRRALAEAQATLDKTMAELKEAQAKLKRVEDKIASLESQLQAAVQKKADLARQVEDCTLKLTRAEKLIGGLGGEKTRWIATVEELKVSVVNVLGDIMISSGTVAYSGAFTGVYREKLNAEWAKRLSDLGVPHTHGCDLRKTLEEPIKTRNWVIAGLPTDQVSVENAIIVSKSRRWPLMIDPQGQANRWIKNLEKDNGLDVVKLTQKDMLRTLENCVRFGRAALLENVFETLDPALEPVLLKQTYKQGGNEVLKIGDNIVPYHADFRFYITTKLANPAYSPEVSVKVTLLSFLSTQEGLEDQLLNTVVGEERPDLSEQKNQLVVANARMKSELKDIEDKILYMLSNSQGNILDDESLIDTLAKSKVTSDQISKKVAEAEITERSIDATREEYRPVAIRASLLFFCIADLGLVDPMYQYSLTWFIDLFVRGIGAAEKSSEIAERISHLNEYFTYSLYVNVCRSLFEKDKLMFSFLLTVKLMQYRGEVDGDEYRFFLAGPTSSSIDKPNPGAPWLTDKSWIEILNLARLPAFEGFDAHFTEEIDHYRGVFDAGDAHREALCGEWDTKLSSLQKLLFLRCLRPDRVVLGMQDFIDAQMGRKFIEPPPFNLQLCYADSSPLSPLVFVLSSGADPMADLLQLAEEMKMQRKFDKVSLGQGQGPKAEKLLQKAMASGMWVCLQNCHLAPSWMESLEQIVENMDPQKVHKDFRLWLTSMPSPKFPVSILQNGVKMTLEPPRGLKSNMARSYLRFTDKYLTECAKPVAWQKMLYGLCLFHAVIQERRKFGPLGWNIRYDFTDGDLSVCQTQMLNFLNDYDDIPYRVIRVLTSEINYGGRITDDKDRRLSNTLLLKFINEDVVREDEPYSFSDSGTYKVPARSDSAKANLDHIAALPLQPAPEIFGLHANAEITCDQNETYATLETVLSLQPRVSAGKGVSREEQIENKCREIAARVPKVFDVDAVQARYPTLYEESMNTVLQQECIRYNGLLAVMHRSLDQAVKAVKGLVVMSPELEAMTDSVFDNRVPEMWSNKAYPSLKALSSWVQDLLERTAFLTKWYEEGVPKCFWISGFYFPQAFLTGTLQNYARKNKMAIDTVNFSFKTEDAVMPASITSGPEDGVYIRGLFLEGARWCDKEHRLAESRPKELYTNMPVMWLLPQQMKPVEAGPGIYMCPVYKILSRAGTLSTTGHSTNFVLFIALASDKPDSHWIARSAAAFTSLS